MTPPSAHSKLAAAIRLVEPLGILFREIRPGIAALAQLAVELGLALGIERLPAFLALGQERELEARVLGAGDPDVGRRQQDVEARTRRPAVDGGDHRLPHPWIVIAHALVDAGLLAVHGSRERPEDALGSQILALFLG